MTRTLSAIRPNEALTVTYQRRLERAIEQMARAVEREVRAVYRANPPEALVAYGQDASPTAVLVAAMRKMGRRWLRQFDELAPKLADYFVTQVQNRNDLILRRDMREAGFTVRFKMTRAMNDAYQAVRAENVSLIKSIPTQYLAQVEQAVMRSVAAGRDMGSLVKEMTERFDVTKRRAALIARDQNNKATSVMQRARQLQLGITKGRWIHSAGGREPRPEHVAFSGKTFDLVRGHDFENGEGVVWPGTAINCRCVYAAVVPGFDDE